MKQLRLIYLIFLPLLFVSCETDFDLNAEWQDITVVYGVLNQNDNTHYLRIQKAYLGKGNVMQMALEADSNLYPGKINVVIEEWKNSMLIQTYVLDTTSIANKEPGVFFSPGQPVYFTNAILHPANTYKLRIIKNNGDTILAQTGLVGDFTIFNPVENSALNFNPPGSDTRSFKWTAANNAGRYQMILYFNYIEVNTDTGDSTYRFTEWSSPVIKSTGSAENELVFSNPAFFKMVENQVLKLDNVKRYPVDVELVFYVAATDLSLYIEVNEPSSSIVQEKPEYTNIENGLGVFSARYEKRRAHPLHINTITKLREMEGYNFQWISTK